MAIFDFVRGPKAFARIWTIDGVPGWVRLAVRLYKVRSHLSTARIVTRALRAYFEAEAPDLIVEAKRMHRAATGTDGNGTIGEES